MKNAHLKISTRKLEFLVIPMWLGDYTIEISALSQ